MRRFTCAMMTVILAAGSLLFVAGCDDVEGQVLDTIGLSGRIVDVWLD